MLYYARNVQDSRPLGERRRWGGASCGPPRKGLDQAMAAHSPRLLEILRHEDVLLHLPEPIQLASGEMSRHFVDGKHAVADTENLELVGDLMLAAVREAGVRFDAVGGLVLGAVPFTFAVAHAVPCKWFLIRKEPKGYGTNMWVEGARLSPGMAVMLVDDVVTTGGSIASAYERVQKAGAEVVFATTLVDRGEAASEFFSGVGVPYKPLATYYDLGIEPVGNGSQPARTTR